MRRLSIIDLAGGHQPIFNEDGSVGVVLNGEIYNFQTLAKELADRGHRFRTRSDSEVIVHAYEEWGADCVQRLQGMFALAVWAKSKEQGVKQTREAGGDERAASQGTLFLARDRLGIKPLYYFVSKEQRAEGKVEGMGSQVRGAEGTASIETLSSSPFAPGNVFLFASEVRTLLASGLVPRKLSPSALQSYLLFGSVSEPMTLVDGVLSLPPGHMLKIELGSQDAPPKPRAYWNIAGAARANGHAAKGRESFTESVQDAAVRVRELLEESIRLHLIADVPVGVFLSSGIDSSVIAALASREVGDVRTFTVTFKEQQYSEAAIAERTARQFGTRHEQLMIDSDEMLSRLSEAVAALDQPSMDGINSYFVSWAARQAGLKVALSGLGGDELFGGYKATFRRTPRYRQLAAISDRVPGAFRSAVAAAVTGAGAGLARGDSLKKLVALWNDSRSLPHPYFFARTLFTPPQVADLLVGTANGASQSRRSVMSEMPVETLWWNWLADTVEQVSTLDPFTAVSCLEARSYLVNTLLRDTDAMSMAHSLEVRVPFLHHPLVEFVARLPEAIKVGNGSSKALLVAAMKDLLPTEVLQQPKRGFTFPWQEWLRGSLRETVARGLSNIVPALAQAVNQQAVSSIWQAYLSGQTSWSRPWSLYVLNEWVKEHLE
jgi:asparagine synthase (glutamine-hydrolysing)